MTRAPFSAKYQASGGTSYSTSTTEPAFMPPIGPSTRVTRDMKW